MQLNTVSQSHLFKANIASNYKPIYGERSASMGWCPRILCSYHVSHNSEVEDLLGGRMNGPLKAEAEHQLGDATW